MLCFTRDYTVPKNCTISNIIGIFKNLIKISQHIILYLNSPTNQSHNHSNTKHKFVPFCNIQVSILYKIWKNYVKVDVFHGEIQLVESSFVVIYAKIHIMGLTDPWYLGV